jgi:hypothetical protein
VSEIGPRWRQLANGVVLTVILAVSAVVIHTSPDRDLQQSAIPVPGVVGEPASGRNIRATVHSVALTESVTAGNGWAGTTPGVWVVADVTVEALLDDRGVTLGTAMLRVGDVLYSASIRPQDATIAERGLSTGVPMSGPLMFEIPAEVVTGEAGADAAIELAASSDPRVDSLLVISVDLTALRERPSVEVDYPVWGDR